MKTYCKAIDPECAETVLPFVQDCFRTKWNRGDYQGLIGEYSTRTLAEIREQAARKGEDRNQLFAEELRGIAQDVTARIKARDLRLEPVRYEMRRDGMSGKYREIGLESPMHQICDHVASGLLKELLDAKLGYYQCASIKGKGQVFGKNAIQRFIERENHAEAQSKARGIPYSNQAKYFVKADVEKCYSSMTPDMVMRWLKRDIGKNKTLLWFVGELLQMHKHGLIIGSILSKDLCNYILSYAYREMLGYHKERRGKQMQFVAFALFYMDDMLAFGPDRRNVKMAANKVDAYLRANFGLHLKKERHVKELAKEPVDMMGYVIHADGHVTIRARIFLKARRTFKRAGERMSLKRAQRVISYKGYFRNSNSAQVAQRIGAERIAYKAGKIVSAESVRRNRQCSISHTGKSGPQP